MATRPDKYQELTDRINVATVGTQGAAHEARFIVPWRMDANLPFGPIKEHDSCSAGEGECGCGISPDEK